MADEDRGFTITRVLQASCDEVFRAWTQPDKLGWFFNGAPSGDVEVDLRVGGVWRQTMIENAETSYVTGGVYREISPVSRLVFTWGAVGGWPDLDLERLDDAPLVEVLLAPSGEQTEMTFRLELPARFSAKEVRDWFAKGIREGWTETLDRLPGASAEPGVRSTTHGSALTG